MKKSNFVHRTEDISLLCKQLMDNAFLQRVNDELITAGNALLAFRDNSATIYYNGNQLCHMEGKAKERAAFTPAIYNRYLPLTRSGVLAAKLKKENHTEAEWQSRAGVSCTFADVLPEILDNIRKDSSPESVQASRFYRFSPLNERETHEIVLLDIEAVFAGSDIKTDRIDLVFYHTGEQRLMFVEVKRLGDSRLKARTGTSAEVLVQMNGYKTTIKRDKEEIITRYGQVIDYYNSFSGASGRKMPPPADKEPLLGLLLVEFTRCRKDTDLRKSVCDMLESKGFGVYAIGDTSRMSDDDTLAAIYEKISKSADSGKEI